MLNRRYLRIKVMQTLYAFFQTKAHDLSKGEKEMFYGIEKIYDLYIYLLSLIPEISNAAEDAAQESRNKRLPTKEDLSPNTRFINNKLIRQLSINKQIKHEALNRKISWANEQELIKRIFNNIKGSKEYSEYQNSKDTSYKADQDFIIEVFKKSISEFELLLHFFEEKSIYWIDDLRLVSIMMIKTLSTFNSDSGELFLLMPLFKDEVEDKKFVLELYRRTILDSLENEMLIAGKTQNWEVDRIAMMDILLMKMAITEILAFSNIPVKVTLNEYIEISKLYSTPKSKLFINGILDKIVEDFKVEQKFLKVGRGLME